MHVFNRLEQVHHQIEETTLEKAMLIIGYHTIKTSEHMLPNGKKLQHNYLLNTAPHATQELDVVIADESGEYVCYAGMWWTPENHLAYMEPLCTIPEYRHKGLAAAALSEMYRRTKALGATHMTGGANRFYQKIGYQNAVKWTFWKKQ